jgi:hypothetical protein
MIDLRGERQVVLFEKRRARVLPARPRVASKPGDEAHARFVEIFRRDTDLLSDMFDGKVPFALPASLAARLEEIREAGQATSSWLTALWQRQRTRLEAVARGEVEAALEPLAAEDRVKYMAVVDPSIKLLLGNAAKQAGVKVSQLVAFAALADGGGPSVHRLKAPRARRAGARPSRRSKRSSRRGPHGRSRG